MSDSMVSFVAQLPVLKLTVIISVPIRAPDDTPSPHLAPYAPNRLLGLAPVRLFSYASRTSLILPSTVKYS
jgi:hypothetical protein